MKRIILLSLLTLSVNYLFSQTFTEQTGISLTGVYNSSVAWGDYDNDGDLDILLTGYTGSTCISKIYKNNGNNTFTEQTGISLTGIAASSVAWGDYNNDGYLDILLTGGSNSSPISKIYKNNGNNTFTEQTEISLTGVAASSVAWGDYDNDGDLDILLTGDKGSFIYISKIYKNNGNNTFTEQTGISLTGVAYCSVAWGDYDNDGDLDILLSGDAGSNKYISKIYKNNGNNSFTEQTQISLAGVRVGSVAWGDYDNDGDLDILLTGESKSGYISKIYNNNGNNTFIEQTGISLTGFVSGSVAWGDYDNDGDLDILLTGYNGSSRISKIYNNNGNNTFTEQTGISLVGVYRGSVAWGDYDNDGDLDILLTSYNSANDIISKIYKNSGSKSNTFPSFPNNLMQTIKEDSVTFTWDKATDNETPQNGLSYNMVIQSNDGKIIKSPLSDISNGIRKVVGIGNVGQNNSWTIKDLPEGFYSWSVQTIDHNYAGSPFAPSGTFVISIPLAKPGTPGGATNLCLNPSSSEYTISSVPGATSYNWSISPSNAGVITGDSITAIVDWYDTFYGTAKIAVIAQNSFVQSVSSDSLTVVVNTPPSSAGVISGDQTVCQGTSDHLYKVAAIAGANSYVWTLPQGAIGTSSSDSITVSFGNSATSDTIKVNGKNSCGMGSENSFSVTINTKPEKPIVTKNSNILQSSATSGNQWYKQSQLISGADQKQYTSTGDGKYYVIVTESGCSSEPSDVLTITGIETIKLKSLVEIYPNPVSKNLTVTSADNGTSIDYEFVDMIGQVIQKGNFIGKTVIETGSFNPGVYLLKIDKGKTNETIKIIKE